MITFRLRNARRDLGFDLLERRQVMTATIGLVQPGESSRLGDILSVSPGDGQTFSIDDAPNQIVVDLKNISPVPWADGSVILLKVGADGATLPVFDRYSALSAVVDDTKHTATIPIEDPLDAGQYRIVLAASDFSQLICDGSWDPTKDQTLADFQVNGQNATFDDAVDLGTIGSNVQIVPGNLDVRGGASYTLYKLTLDSSQPHWRLGLQLDAERIGSEFQGAVTLFDQQGRAIATGNSGEGLGSYVGDPYLFAALEPGVYYVGISGVGNLGGQPGGYDPTTGDPGVSTQVQPGGAYQLELVADPLTSPTKVVDFSLQWGDSSKSPIGFTITFSGALDPDSLEGDPLYLQDSQGKLFPLVYNSVGSQLNQLQYSFGQLLPPGEYSLMIPQEGGLADLVGRFPVADGLPAGTLATWTVRANDALPLAGDEATPVIFSKSDFLSLVANGKAEIAPGRDVTLRLVVPQLAGSLMNVMIANGTLRVQRVDAGGPEDILGDDAVPTADTPFNRAYTLNLSKGIYLLTLSADDAESVTVNWRIVLTLRDFQIANAVGSAGALSLRNAGAVAPAAPTGPIDSPSPSPSPSSSPVGPFTAGALPTSFASTANLTLVGKPSARNDAVSVVGPTVPGGLVAMAEAGRGLTPGIISASPEGDDGQVRNPDGSLVKSDVEETPADATPEVDEIRLAESEDRSVRADATALVEADRLAEAARSVSPWLFRGVKDALEAVAEGDPLRAIEIARNEAAGVADDSDPVERAALGVPVSVVVAAAAAFRFRQLARKWWRRSPAGTRMTSPDLHPFWRGPRFMSPSHRRAKRPLREAQRV